MIGTDGLLGIITQGQPNHSWLPSVLPGVMLGVGMEITLNAGHVLLIDEADLPLIAGLTWHATEQRGRIKGAYAYVKEWHPLWGKQKRVAMHRLLMDFPTCMVDHKNGNPLDNRRSNLRTATPAQNIWNSKMKNNNTLGYRGVKRLRSGRFQALIEKDGVNIHLGAFDTPQEAGAAYAGAAAVLHGKYVFSAREEAWQPMRL